MSPSAQTLVRLALSYHSSSWSASAFFFSALFALCSSPSARASDPTPEQIEFFEKKVRPVLVEHCYSCHAEKKDKGGLRLDTRDATLKGGDSGPALVPGKPDDSLLIKAVRYNNSNIQMPPKGKIPAEQIAALTEWVKMGAPDPRTGKPVGSNPYDIAKHLADAKNHWAYQPVKSPAIPKVRSDRASTPVDAFLLAKLEAAGLTFAKPADKRTLIRRATFDLHGIPPTPDEVDAFEKNPSPNAYAELIETLLKSPKYGERWGRHWLDVARYADNQGGIFGANNAYPYAWTYRDYVIRSFNEDLPYNQFLTEQLAADLLPAKPGDNRHLAALGFVTVGRRHDGNVDDNVYDDRIDTISRGLLGLTVGCARCHDHKLEPIPTVDYYGLYGILKSSVDPQVLPVLEPQADTPDAQKYRADSEKFRSALTELAVKHAIDGLAANRARVGDYLLAAKDAELKTTSQGARVNPDILVKRKLTYAIHNPLVRQWNQWVVKNPAVFLPWLEFAKLKPTEFAEKAKPLAEKFAADKSLHPNVSKAFAGDPPKSLEDVAKKYNAIFAAVDTAWRAKAKGELAVAGKLVPDDAKVSADKLAHAAIDRISAVEARVSLDSKDEESLRKLIHGNTPFRVSPGEMLAFQTAFLTEPLRKEIEKATKAVAGLDQHPGAPARAMVLQDAPKPYNGKVFVRGNPRTQGADAPRAFFTALSPTDRSVLSTTGSGRLELARKIADPANPLTARVLVNRVWAWHFGKGIVGTPSDFGFRGDRPTHPELLDYLAAKFVAEGWSIKKLHREIMLSAAYRQSSRPADAAPNSKKVDPENKLLARMNPRRLEFEAYRDSMLAVAGRLDSTPGGKPVDVTKADTKRRTVYAFVDRKTLPNLFRSFDFPDPNFSSPGRTTTTLPPQALFLLNSPFVVENAKSLAAPVLPKSEAEKPDAVRKLYRAALQRDPSAAELQRSLKFLDLYPVNDVVVPEATAWSYGFADYDEKTKKVTGFTTLRFAGNIVKGTKIGVIDTTGIEISPEGGKTTKLKATCRRWTAPEDGKVDMVAELSHTAAQSDGVLCRVVSSRSGLLGEWTAANQSVPTKLKAIEVKKGDTLDFLTFCRSDPTGDTYRWAPTITMPGREMAAMPGMMMKWDAKSHFLDTSKMPAPLGPWEELAQVLLLSNEFAISE